MDIIVGTHSIKAALENPLRSDFKLYCSDTKVLNEFPADLKKKFKLVSISENQLQNEGKKKIEASGFRFSRIPTHCFLECSTYEISPLEELYSKLESKEYCKILCLDRVSDIHNIAAILRTACFYGFDSVVLGAKLEKGFSAQFYRISSGAPEYLKIYQTNHLSRVLSKLSEKGAVTIGLSEHAEQAFQPSDFNHRSICLALGAEEKGLSHAVLRNVEYKLSLPSFGAIKSLNVSVAAAVAMEKLLFRQ